jgi:uncharacterized protein (DUF697 family)/ethanolamine utilization protein EutP (predicted NTPase)
LFYNIGKNYTNYEELTMSDEQGSNEEVEQPLSDDESNTAGETKQEYDFEKGIRDGIRQEEESIQRPTILVCGYTGSGKTTLIQKICGADIVPDDAIKHGEPGTQDYVPYENKLIKFWDSRGLEPGDGEDNFINMTQDFITELRRDSDVAKHIHLVWYCVQGSGARVTDTDIRLMKEIFPTAQVLCLITKKDAARGPQIPDMTKRIKITGINDRNIIPISDTDDKSLRQVVDRSLDLLPEAYQKAFVSAQVLNVEMKKKAAGAIIHSAGASALATGMIPIPGADAPILATIQTAMLGSLAVLYNIKSEALKTVIGPALAQVLGVATANSLIKLIPGLGNIVAGTVAASITEALGWLAQTYLEACALAKLQGDPIPEINIDLSTIFKGIKI